MKIISRFWKIPAYLLVGWGGLMTLAMVINFATGNIEDGKWAEMFIATIFIAVTPLAIGLVILKKLKNDYKRLDLQRTQKNLLILAKQHKGNLTLSEVMIKLNLGQQAARELLDSQVYKGLATFEITEEGNTYYDFKDY
jgi:hypothetical protein